MYFLFLVSSFAGIIYLTCYMKTVNVFSYIKLAVSPEELAPVYLTSRIFSLYLLYKVLVIHFLVNFHGRNSTDFFESLQTVVTHVNCLFFLLLQDQIFVIISKIPSLSVTNMLENMSPSLSIYLYYKHIVVTFILLTTLVYLLNSHNFISTYFVSLTLSHTNVCIYNCTYIKLYVKKKSV